MSDDHAVRKGQRAAWDGLAPAWEAWEPVIMGQLRPVGAAIVNSLDVAPGQDHLDVASGTGEPGLSIAALAPRGRVVLTDLYAGMLRVAARRAREQGRHNVGTVVCSADALPADDDAFDSVSVRFGHMFFPDPDAATCELARVLRPGGRLCSAVWVEPGENPWTSVAMDAIAAEVDLPPRDPDGPGMYRCAAPGLVAAMYEHAGLGEVEEWDVAVELTTSTAEEYWEVISQHVSLAAAVLRSVDDTTRERIRGRALEGVQPYERDGCVRVPGLARCTVGTAPA